MIKHTLYKTIENAFIYGIHPGGGVKNLNFLNFYMLFNLYSFAISKALLYPKRERHSVGHWPWVF